MKDTKQKKEQGYVIELERIKVFGHHGVNEEETKNGQFFYIDALLKINKDPSKLADDINSTVSYADVNKLIIKIVSEKIYKLIEMLAVDIADSILNNFSDVCWVKVKVSKPDAPMKGEFENVSVSILKYKKKLMNNKSAIDNSNLINNDLNDVFLSLGSNIRNKKNNLEIAIAQLEKTKHVEILKISEYYQTKPVDYENQDDFVNCCLNLKTPLSAFDLLRETQKIENQMGRIKKVRFGPRLIDIDILLFNNLTLQNKQLVVPHPRMFQRAFVLVPLLDILPENNPYFRKVKKSLTEIGTAGVKKYI